MIKVVTNEHQGVKMTDLLFKQQCNQAQKELQKLFTNIVHQQEESINLMPLTVGTYLCKQNITQTEFLRRIEVEISKNHPLSDDQRLIVKNMGRRLWQHAILPIEVTC